MATYREAEWNSIRYSLELVCLLVLARTHLLVSGQYHIGRKAGISSCLLLYTDSSDNESRRQRSFLAWESQFNIHLLLSAHYCLHYGYTALWSERFAMGSKKIVKRNNDVSSYSQLPLQISALLCSTERTVLVPYIPVPLYISIFTEYRIGSSTTVRVPY